MTIGQAFPQQHSSQSADTYTLLREMNFANFGPAFVQFEGVKQSGKITSDKRSLQSVEAAGL